MASFSHAFSFSHCLQLVALALGLSHQWGEGAGWAVEEEQREDGEGCSFSYRRNCLWGDD